MITPFVFFIAVIVFRLIAACAGAHDTWWLNFSPLAAIALCGPMLFPRRVAFILPLSILLVSDIILNVHFGAAWLTVEMVVRYAVLALVALVGMRLQARQCLRGFLPASIACSTGFYLITNTASWLGSPAYAKSFAGWIQSLTTGLPGYPPTVCFFRNSLVSDLCFTAVMLGCIMMARKYRAPAALEKLPGA